MKVLALVIATSLTFNARAMTRDQRLLADSAKVATREFAKQKTRGYLDQVARKGLSQSTRSVARAGGALLFAADLGLSVIDYKNAKTDKGRTYAATNGVIGLVGIGLPVVGLVAAAAITIVSMIDAFGDARLAKDLAMIYEEIARYEEQMLRDFTRIEEARQAALTWASDQIQDASKLVEEGKQYLNAHCSRDEQVETLEEIDSCLKSLVQVDSEYHRRVYALGVLERNADLSLEDIASIKEEREIAAHSNEHVLETLGSYARLTEFVLKNEASGAEKVRDAKVACMTNATQLKYALAAEGHESLRAELPRVWLTRDEDHDQLRREGHAFTHSLCAEIVDGETEFDKSYATAYADLVDLMNTAEKR